MQRLLFQATHPTSTSKQWLESKHNKKKKDLLNKVQTQGEEKLDDIEWNSDEIKEFEQNAVYNIQKQKKIKAKLVITEICKSSTEKKFRQLMSPILTKFDSIPHFGLFHVRELPFYLISTQKTNLKKQNKNSLL